MKYLLICFLLSSCNVVKTLTGGETKPSNDFYDGNGGNSNPNFIFFNCDSGNPCFLSLGDHSVTNMDSSLSNGYEYFFYDGYIFYQATSGVDTDLFRYDLKNKENIRIPLYPGNDSNPNSFTEHQGSLYFFAETTTASGGTLCQLSGSSTNPDCRGSFPIGSNFWVESVKYNDHSQSKLFVCQIAGSDILKEVDINHAGFQVTPVDPVSAPTEMQCENAVNSKPYSAEGFVYSAQGAGYVYKYDVANNSREDVTPSGGPTYGRGSTHQSFLFEDSGNLYVTKPADSVSSYAQIATDGAYNPGNIFFVEAADSFFITEKDSSSNDQILEIKKSNLGQYAQITSFTGETILYLTGIDSGIYIFTATDIYKLSENGQDVIYSGNIYNYGFSTLQRSNTY